MSDAFTDLDRLCVNTIRTLSIDAVQKANSGHPGMPLGAAPMAYVLWQRHLRHDPGFPAWPDRDRFVLSGGHGSMLLYSLLHLTGYDLPLEEIRDFRQWESRTPGHPEYGHTVGVEATTGPLGQGTANAVGMAMAEKWLAAHFNRPDHTIVDHRTWAIVTDGDIMEGVCHEAVSLAGHLRLGKLTFLYDANEVTLDGPASMHLSEDVPKRFEACGWHVLHVDSGDEDLQGLDRALDLARQETERPSLLVIRTTIGFGSPNKSGRSEAHGSPLGDEEVAATKAELQWPYKEPFTIPEEARAHFAEAAREGSAAREDWEKRLQAYAEAHPELADQWHQAQRGELPDGWDSDLPVFDLGDELPTRGASGKVLNALAARIPWLIGGDADLSGSTKTTIEGEGNFGTDDARNIRFGVREHAMAGAVNGLLYHGGVRAFAATFFVFSDYMRPSVRLAALSGLPAIYVWTHDSVAVGEDGPTHEPIEQLASLRAMPHLTVLRPVDANETAAAWRWALAQKEGPAALVLSRQKLPVVVEATAALEGLPRGAYVVRDPSDAVTPEAVLLATGSEVALAVAAHEHLAEDGVPTRVVSMPSWELFEAQSQAWRDEVLLPDAAHVAIEAGSPLGWHRWVGPAGAILSLDRFGASAPGPTVQQKLGFSVDAVVRAVRERL